MPRYQRRTREVNEAILGAYLAGANTRRIRKALEPLLGLSFPPRASEVVSLLVRRPRFALMIAKGGAREIGRAEKAFRHGDDETGMCTFMRAVLGEEFYRRLPESRLQQARENVSTMRAQLIGAGPPPPRRGRGAWRARPHADHAG